MPARHAHLRSATCCHTNAVWMQQSCQTSGHAGTTCNVIVLKSRHFNLGAATRKVYMPKINHSTMDDGMQKSRCLVDQQSLAA